MKLYTFFTRSHLPLLCGHFLPTLEDSFELVIEKKDQLSKSGAYMEDGWIDTMYFKVNVIIRGITENLGAQSVFIHSDVDIQFFGSIEQDVSRSVAGYDIVFQKGSRSINNGFIACRANEKTLSFWNDVKRAMREHHIHDETASMRLLNIPPEYHDDTHTAHQQFQNDYGIAWGYFPVEKFVGGHYCVDSFEKQNFLPPPPTTIMHHATSSVGIDGKIHQLDYVKSWMERNGTMI